MITITINLCQGASIFSLDFSEISIKVASAFHYVLICFGMTSLTSFPDGVLCCFVDPQIQSGLTFDISSFFSTQIFSNFSPPPPKDWLYHPVRTAMVLMDAVLRQRARVAAPCRTLGDLGHGKGTTAKRLATPEDRRGGGTCRKRKRMEQEWE